jgi:hypothetical protein
VRKLLDAPATWLTFVVLILVCAYCAMFSWALENSTYDIWGSFLVGPVLLALSLPVLALALREESDSVVMAIVFGGLALKLLTAVPRYWMSFVLYDGSADASMYAEVGAVVSRQFRRFDFDIDIGGPVLGTGFLVIVTGVVFAFIGPTTLGGYVFFSWLGFWGLFCFYKAFKTALPDADLRRYCLLLFLVPSLLFWPSSIGKDTWMLLCLGVFALGTARVLERKRGGVICIVLGVLGTVFLRPHVTLLACVALGVATLLRRSPEKLTVLGPLRSALTFAVLGATLMVVVARVTEFLGRDTLDVTAELNEANERTDRGGSAFDSAPASSPLELPKAIITVLFRPFPFEAHNLQSLIASAEGTLLLVLALLSVARFRGLLSYVRVRPYVVYVIVYILLFCYIFASFQNFGILTRERVQVFPLVMALLALPVAAKTEPRKSRKPTQIRSTVG